MDSFFIDTTSLFSGLVDTLAVESYKELKEVEAEDGVATEASTDATEPVGGEAVEAGSPEGEVPAVVDATSPSVEGEAAVEG